MEYKVLIKLYVPEVEESYEAYIPINKNVYCVCKLLADLIRTHSREIPDNKTISLYNRYTGAPYDYTKVIRDTDIKNGAQLVAILEDSADSVDPEVAASLTRQAQAAATQAQTEAQLGAQQTAQFAPAPAQAPVPTQTPAQPETQAQIQSPNIQPLATPAQSESSIGEQMNQLLQDQSLSKQDDPNNIDLMSGMTVGQAPGNIAQTDFTPQTVQSSQAPAIVPPPTTTIG